ncbi:TPA: O-antigen polysaccharide polymerase Wzy, partial [Clostridium perfringens]
KKSFSKIRLKLTNKAIWSVGCFLCIISIPSTLFRAYKFFHVAYNYGYSSLYYSENISQGGITMILEMFFMPALICLLIGSNYGKKSKIFVYTIFAIYLLLNLLSGDRGSWIYKTIVLIWLSHTYNKKIPRNKFIKYAVISIICIYILSIIMKFRDLGMGQVTLEQFKQAFIMKDSPIIDVIFEMGGSMGIISLLIVTSNVNGMWTYGNTYLNAIFGVVSTRLLTLFNIPFILVDDWFSKNYMGLSWGMGFSMVGESYLNGGIYFGPIITFFLGIIIGSILYIDVYIDKHNKPIKILFISTSLSTLIGLSRGTIYLYLKTWFYGTVVVCCCIYFIALYLNKHMKDSNIELK